VLPIAKDVKTVAVIGPLADNPSDPENLNPKVGAQGKASSFPDELGRRLGNENVFRSRGGGILTTSAAEIADAVSTAKKADLVILALGESPAMSGEAASRTNLGLPGQQQELLEAVAATGKPVVLILFSGRPLTVPWAVEHVSAILAAWSPGTEAGPALARVLFGEVNPSGRLVVSWPRSVGQEPLYYNALSTGRPATGSFDLSHLPSDVPSKYISRYLDEQNTPQFPFGYGGSYTTFGYGPTQLSESRLSAAELNHGLSATSGRELLTVDAIVSNTGARAGEELVQLYVGLRGTSTAQPVRVLKGFQRIALAAGESKTVRFTLGADAFAIWNDRNQFAVEAAKVMVWIAPDSASGSGSPLEILP
jgi:beta-glucosidase